MPQITKVELHSFSSEDPKFPAKNLIETQVTKKWKCCKPGEKTAFVILKFDKPYRITEIDVGNEYSGLIEVLVANSKQDPPDFKEFLLATSLMSIIEARNESFPNRVRMFNKDLFNPTLADDRWDLIKIVVSQTFNNHRQFGLSFINFHTNDEVTQDEKESPVKIVLKPATSNEKVTLNIPKTASTTDTVTPSRIKTIGKFHFRNSNSSDEEETSPFAQWKNKKDNLNNPKSSSSGKSSPKSDTKSSIKEQLKAKLDSEQKKRKRDEKEDDKHKIKQDRNRSKGLFYDSGDDEPNEKLQKKIEKDKELKGNKDQSLSQKNIIKSISASSPMSRKFASFISDEKPKPAVKAYTTPDQPKRKSETLSPKIPSTSTQKHVKYKPFDKLMDGVVFVISGYQNPERGIMRQKALDMGAKYKADWDDTCTHLICAYSNTPKYNQVKGKGKIISKKWIETCFTEQKMIPWRRFALDSSEQNQPESEDEIHCEWNKPVDEHAKSSTKQELDDSDDDMLIVDRRGLNDDVQVIDSESDSDMAVDVAPLKKEDEVKMDETESNVSQQRQEDRNDSKDAIDINENRPTNDFYSDDSVSSIDITTIECQAFKDKKFYLNGDLTATDTIKLKDIIKNMLGVVTKNPHKANYVISKYGKNVPRNIKGEVVKEIWVRECFDLQAFIPTTRYRLS